MYYMNFDISITEKYHVILENWPLEQFCSPGGMSSHNKLWVLYNALNSDTTHFRKLSDKEFEAWDTRHFKQRLATESSHTSSAPGAVSKANHPPLVPMSTPTTQDNLVDVSQATSLPVIPAPSSSDDSTAHSTKCAAPKGSDVIFSLSSEGIPVQKKASQRTL
jgi:hypothetical protein